jgi:uncharacterized RDD family membrane protein YckC
VTTPGTVSLGTRQGSPAGLITRGIANVVDIAVILILLVVGYFSLSAVLFMFRPRSFSFPEPGRYWSMSLGALAAVIYLAFGWYVSGRTPGKQLTGLRVRTTSGGDLGLLVASGRALLCVVFPIGLLWAAFSRKNASIQDLLLRTAVVYDWRKHTVEADPASL